MRYVPSILLVLASLTTACAQDEGIRDDGWRPTSLGSGDQGTDDADGAGGLPGEASDGEDGVGVFDVGTADGTTAAGEDCVPPDVLVVLDRSQSMHRTPAGATPPNDMAGYQSSRWWIALEALEGFAAQFEQGLALGLETFPSPNSGGCVTLAQRLGGQVASGSGCHTAALELGPSLGNAMAFANAIDPLGSLLCNETPIATALEQAGPTLAGSAGPDHEQFVILLTDGGESCNGDYIGAVQQLVSAGVQVYIVAFGDTSLTTAHDGLNRMACAGETAAGFPGPCVDDGVGNHDAADPSGATLYIAAEDGQALVDAFDGIATQLCCGASCPVG